jgi:hypothetical protein
VEQKMVETKRTAAADEIPPQVVRAFETMSARYMRNYYGIECAVLYKDCHYAVMTRNTTVFPHFGLVETGFIGGDGPHFDVRPMGNRSEIRMQPILVRARWQPVIDGRRHNLLVAVFEKMFTGWTGAAAVLKTLGVGSFASPILVPHNWAVFGHYPDTDAECFIPGFHNWPSVFGSFDGLIDNEQAVKFDELSVLRRFGDFRNFCIRVPADAGMIRLARREWEISGSRWVPCSSSFDPKYVTVADGDRPCCRDCIGTNGLNRFAGIDRVPWHVHVHPTGEYVERYGIRQQVYEFIFRLKPDRYYQHLCLPYYVTVYTWMMAAVLGDASVANALIVKGAHGWCV